MQNSESDKRSDDIATTSSQTQSQTLPYHIIMDEILPRFPVKSIIRFKLVCKHWNSTISSYKFAKLRLKFNNFSDNFFVIGSYSGHFCDFGPFFNFLPQNEYTNMNQLIKISVNVFTDSLFPLFDLEGCCDGLVCFLYGTEKSNVYCVWNPVTRECREISIPDSVTHASSCGFGYVSSRDDYKVVLSFKSKDKWLGFHEFWLREGKWKRIGALDDDIGRRGILYHPVWIDGIVFWRSIFAANDIIMLNSETEELKVYSMTIWLNNGYREMCLYRLHGCLSLRRFKPDGTSNFWVLKKFDDWSSWEELFTINLYNIFFVGLFDNGKCLLRSSDQFRLVDLSKEALERAHGDFNGQGIDTNLYGKVYMASYTQSLVSPFGTTESDEEETENYEV